MSIILLIVLNTYTCTYICIKNCTSITIGVIYRSPNLSLQENVSEFPIYIENLYNFPNNRKATICFAGDFNITL